MPIIYSEDFKSRAVALLNVLANKTGEVIIQEVEIRNVRELVKYLGISSFTLYKWKKELES